MLSAIGGGALEVAGFELVYVTAPGDGVRVGLADAWALGLESVPPVRRFASYRGQRHLSGCWWSATDGRHVGFESWLERDHVMALDFDPAVGAIASQPFWLLWPAAEGGGRYRSHAPDYFVRRVDGSAVVVDCRPEHRRKPSLAAEVRRLDGRTGRPVIAEPLGPDLVEHGPVTLKIPRDDADPD